MTMHANNTYANVHETPIEHLPLPPPAPRQPPPLRYKRDARALREAQAHRAARYANMFDDAVNNRNNSVRTRLF